MVMLAGCTKELAEQGDVIPEGALRVVAEEGSATGSKVTVSGTGVYWEKDEPIRVNGKDLKMTISRSREDRKYYAYIDSIERRTETYRDYIYACTPRTLFDNFDDLRYGTDYNMVTRINAPRTYKYRRASVDRGGVRQAIDSLPMFGRTTTDATSITMKHLTAIIEVKVTNSANLPVKLDSIVISTGSYTKPLSGRISYLMRHNGEDALIPEWIVNNNFVESYNASQLSVCMDFTEATDDERKVAVGSTKNVQIPIIPVKYADLRFKIYGKTDWTGVYDGAAMYVAANPAPGTQFIVEERTYSTHTYERNHNYGAPMTITSADAGTDKGIFTLGPFSNSQKVTHVYWDRSFDTDRLITKDELMYLLDGRGNANTARFILCRARIIPGTYYSLAYYNYYLCVFPDGVNKNDLPEEIRPYVNVQPADCDNMPSISLDRYYHLIPETDWAKGCMLAKLRSKDTRYNIELANEEVLYSTYSANNLGYSWTGGNSDLVAPYLYVRPLP